MDWYAQDILFNFLSEHVVSTSTRFVRPSKYVVAPLTNLKESVLTLFSMTEELREFPDVITCPVSLKDAV